MLKQERQKALKYSAATPLCSIIVLGEPDPPEPAERAFQIAITVIPKGFTCGRRGYKKAASRNALEA